MIYLYWTIGILVWLSLGFYIAPARKPHPLVGEVVHDTVIDTFLPPGLNLGSAFSSDIKAAKTEKSSVIYIKSVCKYCGKEVLR